MSKEHIGSNFDEWLKEIGEGYLINISACKHFKGLGECEIMEGLCIKNECYYKECERLKAENEKCKQALEDVREKVLFECKRCGKNITSYCEQCWVNDILSKTNEVLKDEH